MPIEWQLLKTNKKPNRLNFWSNRIEFYDNDNRVEFLMTFIESRGIVCTYKTFCSILNEGDVGVKKKQRRNNTFIVEVFVIYMHVRDGKKKFFFQIRKISYQTIPYAPEPTGVNI